MAGTMMRTQMKTPQTQSPALVDQKDFLGSPSMRLLGATETAPRNAQVPLAAQLGEDFLLESQLVLVEPQIPVLHRLGGVLLDPLDYLDPRVAARMAHGVDGDGDDVGQLLVGVDYVAPLEVDLELPHLGQEADAPELPVRVLPADGGGVDVLLDAQSFPNSPKLLGNAFS